MYYIMLTDSFRYGRVTGFVDPREEETRPYWIGCYHFDDEQEWSDEDLAAELSRVSCGKTYDNKAMIAIDLERNRRKGESVPTFENIEELIAFWNYSVVNQETACRAVELLYPDLAGFTDQAQKLWAEYEFEEVYEDYDLYYGKGTVGEFEVAVGLVDGEPKIVLPIPSTLRLVEEDGHQMFDYDEEKYAEEVEEFKLWTEGL